MERWSESCVLSKRAAECKRSHAEWPGGWRLGEVGYSKSLFPEKILLLYHSVDPTGSQTVSRVSPFLYNTALETRLTLGAVECHSAAG